MSTGQEVEQARVRLQNLLQSALEGGTLETAIRELLGSEARIRLQNQLAAALESGELETAVRELVEASLAEPAGHEPGGQGPSVGEPASREPGGHGPSVGEPGGHGPSVGEPGGYEPGGHGPFVSDVSDHRPPPDRVNPEPPRDPEAVRAKETIRRVLEDGLQDGRLDGVLENLRGERIRGAASPEIRAARDRMLQVLETAVSNGSLKSALDDIFGQDNAASAKLEDTRKKLHSDLQSATRTDQLKKALQTAMEKHMPSNQASRMSSPRVDDSTQEQTVNNSEAAGQQRKPVRRSQTQDIGTLRDQLKNLKTENETLREKVSRLETLMERAEEKKRRDESVSAPAT